MKPTPIADGEQITVSVGSGTVTVAGRNVRMSDREREVSIAIAASGRSLSALALVELLYPDGDYDRATQALRVTIHRIRSRVRPNFILFTDTGYMLGPGVTVDLDEGRKILLRLRAGSEPSALAEIRSRALDLAAVLRAGTSTTLALRDWFVPFARHANRLGREIAMEVAREALADGRYLDANTVATSLTYEEPSDEAAWELVVASQLLLGRRVDAVESVRLLRAYLSEELGVPPSERLQQLIGLTIAESRNSQRLEALG